MQPSSVDAPPAEGPRIPARAVAGCLLAVVLLARWQLPALWRHPLLAEWATVFAAICIQALPFVLLGVVVAAVIAVAPVGRPVRWAARHPVLAVPLAALAGGALPGCECAAVPVVGALRRHGAPPGVAIAFMVAAPAVNPAVLVATAAAFPGRPGMVLARALASLLVAVSLGLLWQTRFGVPPDADRCSDPSPGTGSRHRIHTAHRHDPPAAGWARVAGAGTAAAGELARSLALVSVGAAAAAALVVGAPRTALGALAGRPELGILAMGVLAVLLAVCSTADAFVASALSVFPARAQLAFVVVGPVVDVKLAALQAGSFGAAFARRFLPAAFAVALGCAWLFGRVVL